MSFDIHKYNSNNMSKILKHNTRYRDEPGRDVKYANPDIDKTKVHLNYPLGEVRKDPRQYIKDRIKEIDTLNPPKRIKKDRVLMVGFSIAVPEALVGTGREREFFEAVYDWECKVFGKDNIVGTDIHRDEIHDYWDAREDRWRTSREHLHSVIIPVTKDAFGLKVNAKEFINRERMKALHQSLNKYIYDRFKVHTVTNATHVGMDTEDLKRTSIEKQAIKSKDLSKTIDQKAKTVGKLTEQELTLTKIKDERYRDSSLAPVLAADLMAAKAETERNIYKQQITAILDATKALAPELYWQIKDAANKKIDRKYINLGIDEINR